MAQVQQRYLQDLLTSTVPKHQEECVLVGLIQDLQLYDTVEPVVRRSSS